MPRALPPASTSIENVDVVCGCEIDVVVFLLLIEFCDGLFSMSA
jgi:hypothetical protein